MSDTSSDRVEGPIAGDPFLMVGNLDLESAGYTGEEWFLSGTATSYSLAGERGEESCAVQRIPHASTEPSWSSG